MFGNDQTLLIRALNATRQVYFPSYIGLRLIVSQLQIQEAEYLQRLVSRRLLAGDTWRFKPFKLYKGSIQTPEGYDHHYRECLASSPLTAFAEALILKWLAESSLFQVSPRVYSYRWPYSNRSGVSYRYFFEGYKQRNNEIASALSQSNRVVVVSDLKSFYPSANKEQVLSVLQSRLQQCDNQPGLPHESIFQFFAQLLAANGNGIPIGPASGHVLGQLALHDVDSEMTSKYGSNYFRYVDDIAVVCDVDDAGTVKQDIQRCVEQYGFSINADKTLVTTHTQWQHSIMRADVSETDTLRLLCGDLAAYLAFHPGRADELKMMFTDAGLSIPVGRLFALSQYSRFRLFLRRKNPIKLYFSKNADFLGRGKSLKADYEKALSEFAQTPKETSPNLRRWQIQKARRIINSLFYLRRFEDWKHQASIFHAFPELVEQQALAKALSTGSVNPILPFYGSGPAAFAELWSEHGHGNASLLSLETGLSRAEIDGLITLRLYGIIPTDVMQFIEDREELRLLRIVSRTSVVRSKPDLSFDDEFESLRLGASFSELSTLARTRYSLSEGSVLEALSLLSSEYRS